MVLRRSTTDWTWPRLLRRVARSIVAFIASPCPFASCGAWHRYSEASGRSGRGSEMQCGERMLGGSAGNRCRLSSASAPRRCWWITPFERFSSAPATVALVPAASARTILSPSLGRGQRAAAHRRQLRLAACRRRSPCRCRRRGSCRAGCDSVSTPVSSARASGFISASSAPAGSLSNAASLGTSTV